MELNDNEFDAAFRRKVFDADPQFEDEAWNKMESKLKRRDRVIFIRKSAIALLVLLVGVWGYYGLDELPVTQGELKAAKKEKSVKVSERGPAKSREMVSAYNKGHLKTDDMATLEKHQGDYSETNPIKDVNSASVREPEHKNIAIDIPVGITQGMLNNRLTEMGVSADIRIDKIDLSGLAKTADAYNAKQVASKAIDSVAEQTAVNKKVSGNKRNMPISMALSAGPEFNSASSVVGGDPGFSAGLTVGFGISKKLDLQTGLRYSVKKYNNGPGIRYDFPHTGAWTKYNLTSLDATCNVLEIPLQASYNLLKKRGNMLNLNAGISSYLMLKEDYEFKYDTPYGAAAKVLEKRNANQHLFSIVDLSATYFIKLKSTNLKLGLEPFVKVPLSGVGEGNINLKSSGISLKLRYDLEKKSN